jgi:Domain of unknown function (DUF5615)
MLCLLIDHNFDHDILRGLVQRIPDVDAVTALEIQMSQSSDTELLLRAAEEQRVLVTHDVKTMPAHAVSLMKRGENISGVLFAGKKVMRLVELICRGGNEPEIKSAALLVLMATIEQSPNANSLAYQGKQLTFNQCCNLDIYEMIERQVTVCERELLRTWAPQHRERCHSPSLNSTNKRPELPST